MRRDDFFVKPPSEKPKDVILFAGHNFTHFNDECFLITDGVESLPHAKEAQALTAETALWAYKVVRQRPFYWKEKLPFLKRIFRSTNLRLWQKRRDPGYAEGLASALIVLITINDYFWIGSAGNCNSFLYREGLIDILTKRDVNDERMLTKAVGFARRQLIPSMHSEKLLENDVILLTTDSVADYVSEDDLRMALEETGVTAETLQAAADRLITIAKTNGSTEDASVCVVKRIITSE